MAVRVRRFRRSSWVIWLGASASRLDPKKSEAAPVFSVEGSRLLKVDRGGVTKVLSLKK